jgi:aspartyl-tRNA(Asn)/glutamyl-tRNA(Gln) amidotransferase subunit A
MRNDDIALWTLSEVADAIAARRISSVEATEACLARIEVWQPRVNAFLRIYRDKALAQARAMDAELAAGKRRGPLHGVPMAHKDMYYRKGELSTGGSAIRKDWVAPVTATVLQKLDAAGVVELGFLNMAEFAAGPTGHNVHHGHCRNPWTRAASPAAARAARAPRWRRGWSMARWAPTPAARSACRPQPAAWSV